MKRSIQIIVFSIFLLGSSLFAQNNAEKAISKTNFCIGETVRFYSETLSEDRSLNIYLPISYGNDANKKYPVIYLLDGSADEDFIHIAGLVQFGSFSWINMIPESIVVGIVNVNRKRDFTFPSNSTRDKLEFPLSGESENFIHFLETEVQTFIQKNYHITNEKTLIGQSLGGLLATEILFKKPEMFDNYIIVSPSLWWDDETLLQFKPKSYKGAKSIYIAVGKEGPNMERMAYQLKNKLTQLKVENTALYFNFLQDSNHGDALHLAVYDAFKKIFATPEEK
ncbi:hypothetical protein ATE92_0407 [Ulvibacter sp. MAR_2010_11]|uniref:alpha/beta hydrolase n=1 Tax=Ulvibacter sp. MAR_2010_11 TaxID=1250229 RepID=UPI000CA84901|nr:alpha/beta hydrolase-fold protein [Ulvibacter sp. MAR_2010_11]PKA82280.1 hypothetical protein ATE92_0407 [Ulvibacter sp. MAR_2010_11]